MYYVGHMIYMCVDWVKCEEMLVLSHEGVSNVLAFSGIFATTREPSACHTLQPASSIQTSSQNSTSVSI
jgi:hypothetical protein